MAFAEWAGIAAPYDRSFGALCACTIPEVLSELGALPVVAEGAGAAALRDARLRRAPQGAGPEGAPLEGAGLEGAGLEGVPPQGAAPQGAAFEGARAARGPRLLDVGTGTGSVALAATRAGWQVDAFDAERSMIDFAAGRPDAAGIRFATARLPELPYPDAAFDAATANFAINHVDHPRAGLAAVRRVLKPGGRLVATVWPWEATPTGRLWREIQDETGARPPEGNRLPEGSDFERSEDGLAGLLADCGFAEITARRVRFIWRVGAGDLWSGVEAGIALIGYAHAAADAPTRRAMKAAYDARTPAFAGQDGLLHFEMSAVLATGRRPLAADRGARESDS
jgi:SAM-dependent methyltransferase